MKINCNECQYNTACLKYKSLISDGVLDIYEENVCQRKTRLDEYYRKSRIPYKYMIPKLLTVDDSSPDKKKYGLLESIVKNKDSLLSSVELGRPIYIQSVICGNGKTTWATNILHAYINYVLFSKPHDKCVILFINVPSFLIDLKEHIKSSSEDMYELLESIQEADIVVWDDIATKSITEFEAENLYRLIDRRCCTKGKLDIYTSNLSDADVKSKLGERLSSRIITASLVFRFEDKDKRGV